MQSTETTITVTWSFTAVIATRLEEYRVAYGNSMDGLDTITNPVLSVPGVQQYSAQLLSLQPGTMYFYQILSVNHIAGRNDSTMPESTKTMDTSEFSFLYSIIILELRSLIRVFKCN